MGAGGVSSCPSALCHQTGSRGGKRVPGELTRGSVLLRRTESYNRSWLRLRGESPGEGAEIRERMWPSQGYSELCESPPLLVLRSLFVHLRQLVQLGVAKERTQGLKSE